MVTKFSEHWQLHPGLLIPQGLLSSATPWNTLNRLCDISLILSISVLIETYMCDHLSFSALFFSFLILIIMSICHRTLPFHLGEGKACSILQKFSAELSEEAGLTSEKSWRFEFSIRKNFSSNYRIVVNGISTSIRTLHNCVSLDPKFCEADNSTG